MTDGNLRLAVLIDGDNAPRDCLKSILEEIAIYGTPTIKRIYGDWASQNIIGWKTELLENAVTPKQQFAYTAGKNSTDSAMIIDAMDILYAGKTDGFVLVSSDSDFTPLAIRLRESGMYVIGIGEAKTPNAFVQACDKFIRIEVLRDRVKKSTKENTSAVRKNDFKNDKIKKDTDTTNNKTAPKPKAKQESKSPIPEDVIELIVDSIEDLAEDDGYTNLSALGNLLIKKKPDFDSRTYGFGKLSTMLKSLPCFEFEMRSTAADPNAKQIYVTNIEG
ncbi:MAG: NYN domain-containing protein [Candidatus Scatomorpha sp.]|jgi:uncharacterized protein (TIGR00288 family)